MELSPVPRWINNFDPIRGDVRDLTTRRIIMESMVDMLGKAKVPRHHPFVRWLVNMYGPAQALGLRRHLSKAEGEASLTRWLLDIKATLEARIAASQPLPPRLQPQALVNTLDHPGVDVSGLIVDRITADIAELENAAAPIRNLANTRYAHQPLAKLNDLDSTTFGQLHKALETLIFLVSDYDYFIDPKGGSYGARYDWKQMAGPLGNWARIFETPLIRRESPKGTDGAST